MDKMLPRRGFIARVGRAGFSMLLSLALLGIAASGVAIAQGYGRDNDNDKYGHGSGACKHTHYVAAGENLTWIAERYGITVDELAKANDLHDTDYIVENQELCVPHGSAGTKYDGYGSGYGDSGRDDRHSGNNGYDNHDSGKPNRRDGSYREHADSRECGSWREDAYGFRYQDCVLNGDDDKSYGGKGHGGERYGGPEHRNYEQQGCQSYDCGGKSHNRYEYSNDWDYRNQSCIDHRPGHGYSPYDCGGNDNGDDNGNDNGNGDNGNGDNGNGNGNGNSEPPNGAG